MNSHDLGIGQRRFPKWLRRSTDFSVFEPSYASAFHRHTDSKRNSVVCSIEHSAIGKKRKGQQMPSLHHIDSNKSINITAFASSLQQEPSRAPVHLAHKSFD